MLGIGSSSSTDGGTGMLTALGARFTDAAGVTIPLGARGLDTVAAADLSGLRALPSGGVLVLSDVTNPLLGAFGSAAIFGPQKGLGEAALVRADAGLARLAKLLPADPQTPGAGAAGGVGFGLLAWGARLVPGAAEVAELVDLRGALAAASVVVTGEGAFDGQSAAGKAADACRRAGSRGGRAGRARRGADLAGCRHLGVRGVRVAHRTRRRWRRRHERAGAVASRGGRRARPRFPRLTSGDSGKLHAELALRAAGQLQR